jgi:hypothetical protein
MKKIPSLLANALRTTFAGRIVELDPIEEWVIVYEPDGAVARYRIDFFDGLVVPLLIDEKDRTSEVIRALGVVFEEAPCVIDAYETAGFVALRKGAAVGRHFDLPYIEATALMRAYRLALERLESWCGFHTELADQGAPTRDALSEDAG